MLDRHSFRTNYEPIVLNFRHQTAKQGEKEQKGTKTASAGRGGGDLMETTQTARRRVRYQIELCCMKVIDGER